MGAAIALFVIIQFTLAASLVTPAREQLNDLTWMQREPRNELHFNESTTDADTPPGSPFPPSEEDPDDAIWHKAYCRGATLLKAMTLDEQESSRMLQWPYTQSPWDGDLKDALKKWGYLDDPTTHEQNDAQCDFDNWHHSRRAFEALGINWKSAGQGGPNHCFFVQHANGPAVLLDKKTHQMPEPQNQRYEVDGTIYKVTTAYSRIGINRKDGIVYFLHRRSPEKAAELLWGLKEDEVNLDELPKIRASSDLAWGFWNRFPDKDLKHITMFMAFGIVNDDTATVIIPRALKAAGGHEVQPWPGTDIIVGHEGQEEAALALIGSPNGLGAGYFLLQHKQQLGGAKFIWKIKIFKGDDPFDSEDPNIIFYVDPNAPPMPPEEDTPGSTPQSPWPDGIAFENAVKMMEPKIVKASIDGKSLVRKHVLRAKL